MNYIDEIFLRADIQQIREFLLNGVECEPDPRPYRERLAAARAGLTARLHEKYPDDREYEEIAGLVYPYVTAAEGVYLELGLQAGAILTAQVCQNLKTAFEGR